MIRLILKIKFRFKRRLLSGICVFLALSCFLIGIVLFLNADYKKDFPLKQYNGIYEKSKYIKPDIWDTIFQTNSDHCFYIYFENNDELYKVMASFIDIFDRESFETDVKQGDTVTLLMTDSTRTFSGFYKIYEISINGKKYLNQIKTEEISKKIKHDYTTAGYIIIALGLLSTAICVIVEMNARKTS